MYISLQIGILIDSGSSLKVSKERFSRILKPTNVDSMRLEEFHPGIEDDPVAAKSANMDVWKKLVNNLY